MRPQVCLAALMVVNIFLFLAGQAWAPDTPGPIAVAASGGASGGPVMSLRNGDIINHRNIQFGYCDKDGCDPNGDMGAGGDGTPERGPRGRLGINYDVGKDFVIWNGRKGPLAWFSRKRSVLYSDNKPMIKLEHGQIYLYRKPIVIH